MIMMEEKNLENIEDLVKDPIKDPIEDPINYLVKDLIKDLVKDQKEECELVTKKKLNYNKTNLKKKQDIIKQNGKHTTKISKRL